MNKHAQAAIDESGNAVPDSTSSNNAGKKADKADSADKEQLYLKLKKEAEIRMQLDEFAREFALARAERATR